MCEGRKRRRILRLEGLIIEIEKKMADIAAIRHRVNTGTALRQDQQNLLEAELDAVIEDRNRVTSSLNGVGSLNFVERTASYASLKDNILQGHPVEMHLIGLLNKELDAMEQQFRNEKRKLENELRELRRTLVQSFIACVLSYMACLLYFSFIRRFVRPFM